MALADVLISEFDHEMATTRKLLELVPEDQAAWKPHPKSFTLGELSLHLANLPTWAVMTAQETEFDMAPSDGSGPERPTYRSPAATLEYFDENIQKARAAIISLSDADMTVPWTLKHAGQTVFSMPRAAVLRSFVMNHLIHHRGQLTVYLRQCDVPLPSVYGPTADGGGM